MKSKGLRDRAVVGTTKRLRAVIYTRVSLDRSGEGASNERQKEKCVGLADLNEWDVVAVEEDISISAYSGKKRPAWERVLDMIERGEVDVVIAYNMDRMTRSMSELERLINLTADHKVDIKTFEGQIDLSSEMGRMVARILTAVARAEVERKGARQKLANEQRAREGVAWTSGFRPFGYDVIGKKDKDRLIINETEADLIRTAAEDVLNGTPLRAIVRRWKELEVPTARSRKNINGWTHNSVRSILLNPRNAGIATYNGEVVGRGKWKPIISEETHVLLVATLTDPARTTGDDDRMLGNKPRNLLSGIAVCGECGWKVEAGSNSGRKVYKCSNPDGDHITTHREQADNIVRSSLAMAIGTTGTVTKPRDKTVPPDLWGERERINDRLEKMTVSWAEGVLTDGMFEAGSESLKDQLTKVEAQIEAGANEPDDTNLRWEEARKFTELDMWGQRRVLEDLTEIKLWAKNRKHNVAMKHQVTVHVTDLSGRTWAALDERNGQAPDPSAATYEALADILVREQPEGITSLAKASQWLVDHGHTDRSPGGLPGKLSPLLRHVRGETRSATGWARKGGHNINRRVNSNT